MIYTDHMFVRHVTHDLVHSVRGSPGGAIRAMTAMAKDICLSLTLCLSPCSKLASSQRQCTMLSIDLEKLHPCNDVYSIW